MTGQLKLIKTANGKWNVCQNDTKMMAHNPIMGLVIGLSNLLRVLIGAKSTQ